MKTSKTILIAVIAGLLLLTAASWSVRAAALAPEEIRSLTEEATIWGFPVVMNYKLISDLFDPNSPRHGQFNTLRHGRQLSTAKNRLVRGPNNDTLYSIAVLDLEAEPMVFHVPDAGNRYYSFQFVDLLTNNIGYIGTRATGNGEGWYAATGPNWRGQLPSKIPKAILCPSRFVLVLGRTAVNGEADLPNVIKQQDGYKLMPLSRLSGKSAPKSPGPDFMPFEARKAQSLEFFSYLNFLIQYQHLIPGEQALVKKFSVIGIAPGKPFDPAALAEPTRKAMEEGMQVAMEKIQGRSIAGRMVNGWALLPTGVKFFGDDYFFRAFIFAKGPYPNDTEEAFYPRAILDDQGQLLNGADHRYVLRLSKEDMSLAKYFWSLTMYDAKEGLLVENPINRYSISNRTPGLKYGADGSLTIDLRNDSPGAGRESNWLPAPKESFYLSFRIYGPKEDVLNGKWAPPAVKRLE